MRSWRWGAHLRTGSLVEIELIDVLGEIVGELARRNLQTESGGGRGAGVSRGSPGPYRSGSKAVFGRARGQEEGGVGWVLEGD